MYKFVHNINPRRFAITTTHKGRMVISELWRDSATLCEYIALWFFAKKAQIIGNKNRDYMYLNKACRLFFGEKSTYWSKCWLFSHHRTRMFSMIDFEIVLHWTICEGCSQVRIYIGHGLSLGLSTIWCWLAYAYMRTPHISLFWRNLIGLKCNKSSVNLNVWHCQI